MTLGPRSFRFFLNLYPPFLFNRIRVKHIGPDWRTATVTIAKSLLTRNYVGTTFGGSLYTAADPIFMLLLAHILDIREYIIWDKGATIDFIKPARTKLSFNFEITEADLKKIQEEVASRGKSLPEFWVEGVDKKGQVCLKVKKLLYIKKKTKKPQ